MSTARTPARAKRAFRLARQGAAGLACAGFAAGHLLLLMWTQDKGIQSGLVNWPVLLAPALLSALMLPSSALRCWKWWAGMYVLVLVCNPVLLPQVLLVAETFVLYVTWVRQRRPGDLGWLRSAGAVFPRRFRRATRGGPGAAPAASSTAKPPDARAKTEPTPKRARRGPAQTRADAR